ncbi:MAG: hypothetical protein JNL01_08505 [Bdellovibrionales bacterium]|nr:hypothetical protein [Bdellovibrionales bacterium]
MLENAASIVAPYFSSVRTFLDVPEFFQQLSQNPPDFILLGGAIGTEIRSRVRDEIAKSNRRIGLIEPNGPSDILNAVQAFSSRSSSND